MTTPSTEQLIPLLQATLSPNADHRKQAEQQLQLLSQVPEFPSVLLTLILNSSQMEPAVIHSASIYFKNLIRRYWDDDEETVKIADQDRNFIRSHLLQAITASPTSVRNQLTCCLGNILSKDFPDRWPNYVQDTFALVTNTESHVAYSGLLCLSEIVKLYRWRSNEKRAPLNMIIKATFSTLTSMALMLLNAPGDHAESGLMLKEIFKIYFCSMSYELPASLRTDASISQWGQLLISAIEKPVTIDHLRDDLEEVAKLPWFRAKKWAFKSLNKLFQRYGNPSLDSFKDDQYKAFGKNFISKFAPTIMNCYFKQIEASVRGETVLPPKIANMIILFLTDCVKNKTTWNVLKGHIEALISHFMFPLVCFTDRDQELWDDDQVEYLQKKTDPLVDFENPAVSSLQFMMTLVKDRPSSTQVAMLQFLQSLLATYQPTIESARRKDGALAMLGAMNEVLLGSKSLIRDQVPDILRQHLLPELQSPFPFLRVRACEVLRAYASLSTFDFPGDQEAQAREWQSCFLNVLQVMHTPDLIVKVNGALTIGELIEREGAHAVVAPHLSFIMETLLSLTNQLDMETLTGVMERFVELFPNELIPFSVQLCVQLRDSLLRLASEIKHVSDSSAPTDDFSAWDESGDKTMAAMGILKTISTLILGVPDEMADRQLLLEQLEQAVMPALVFILSNKVADLYEETFEVVDCCTFELKRITPTMWSLLDHICAVLSDDGIDFIEDIFPSLDNYISYGADRLKTEPQLQLVFANIIQLILSKQEVDDSDRLFSFKLMESMLLNLKGSIDNFLEPFLRLSFENLNDKKQTPFFVHCLEVPVNCLYYNPIKALTLMNEMNATAAFFSVWFRHHGKLSRVHDKKLSSAALLKTIADTCVDESALSIVKASYPVLMSNLISFLSALPKAEEEREEMEKMYDDDDDSKNDSDEEGESDTDSHGAIEAAEEQEEGDAEEYVFDDQDVPDEEAQYMEYLNRRAQRSVGHAETDDESDDEDWCQELGEELYYESPLDDVDVYIQFQELTNHLSATKPEVYQLLTMHLTPEENEKASAIVAKAQQNLQKKLEEGTKEKKK